MTQKAMVSNMAARSEPCMSPQRQRKWLPDGLKLRKKNAQGILQYDVSIVSARYDHEHHTWMYKLNDWQDKPIEGETAEIMLAK